jgi:hypothetical protein
VASGLGATPAVQDWLDGRLKNSLIQLTDHILLAGVNFSATRSDKR